MARSRRSPVLRDQWRVASDTRDRRGRNRPRGSDRGRGRKRYSDRERHFRPTEAPSDRPPRSPSPSRPFPEAGREAPRKHRETSPSTSTARRSPGPPPIELREDQGAPARRPSLSSNHPNLENPRPLGEAAPEGDTERGRQRDDSPAAPPPIKRKRTRSPSPRFHRNHHRQRRHRPSRRGGGRDRSPPRKRRGRLSGRGASSRRSPRRGRERRDGEFDRFGISRRRFSRSPIRGERPYTSPRRPSRSPHTADYSDRDSFYRSPSRHSVQSGASGLSASAGRGSRSEQNMNSTKPIRSIVDESARSPSPPRPIPSFDADNTSDAADGDASLREAFPMHGMRASDVRGNQRSRPARPPVDSRQYSTSPQYVTPTGSYHGSPQSTSPYSGGRGGWGGQPPYHPQHG